MATSGSTDFNLTANELIEESLKLLGVQPAESPIEAFELQDAISSLNMMLKGWQAQGFHLWTKTEGVVFLEPSVSQYSLGTDRAARADDFISTTTTANAAALATSLSVTDTTGMAVSDVIGIELDDGTRHWTTIATIPDSTSLTITTGIASVAASGVSVYTYTTVLERPLKIYDFARRQTFGQNNEIEITKFSRKDYFTQVDKTSTGTVTGFYYSPQLTTGELYIWQPVSTVTELLKFSFERPIEDIDISTNDIDIPVEWLETVAYNLAVRLADQYTVSPQKLQSVMIKAQIFLDNLLGWDDEMNDLHVEPV